MNSVASAAGHSALQVFSSSGKRAWHGGERDREIGAVAGAHADGAEGAGRRAEIGAGRRRCVVVAEQIVEEAAALAARGVGILRAAIVLRQRRQHRAALVLAVGAAEAAAAQPLEAGGDLVEIAAHLLDLVVDRTALRRLAVEQREEAGAVAAHALGLQRDAIEFGLLLWLRLPDSGGSARPWPGSPLPAPRSMVASCASSRWHIGLACGALLRRRRRRVRRVASARRASRARARRLPSSTAQVKIQRERGSQSASAAYPAIETIIRAAFRSLKRAAEAAWLRPGASNTRFSGQRHVVSGAQVWQSSA